jgi:hypothetical protein
LPFSIWSPASSKIIEPTADALGRFADQHRARLGDRLQPRSGVDDDAGDHALVRRADRDSGLARQDSTPRLDPRPERSNGANQLEGRAHRTLSIILASYRRAPHRHHGVADELFDRSAVPADQLARQLEVPAQRLPNLFGVALLGEGREADEIREHDGNQPPFS